MSLCQQQVKVSHYAGHLLGLDLTSELNQIVASNFERIVSVSS